VMTTTADQWEQVGGRFASGDRKALIREVGGLLLRRPWRLSGWLLLAGLAVPRRWSGPVLGRVSRWLYIPGMSPAWRFQNGRRIAEPPADVVAVVLTVGEGTLDECVASVRGQSLSPRETQVIENVAPISEACNRALDLADGEFHAIVDADMVLDRHCFRDLVRMLRSDPNAFCALAMLRDELLGKIAHVKMFRTALTSGVRYEDAPGCDMVFYRAVKARGHSAVMTDRALGRHCSVQDNAHTYHVFARRGQKSRQDRPGEVGDVLHRLAAAYVKRRDADTLLALTAYCHGLFGEQSGEKDFRSYEDGDVRKMQDVLDAFDRSD